jgi:hypothetical protein
MAHRIGVRKQCKSERGLEDLTLAQVGDPIPRGTFHHDYMTHLKVNKHVS